MNEFIPPASPQKFTGGIQHPELYLWDAWSYVDGGAIHLYCLAINRTRPDGEPLQTAERNDFPFHVRHFLSSDEGRTWSDEGCFQEPGKAGSGHDARNVWSGSIEPLPGGQLLVGYTGLYEIGGNRNYLQNIALARSSDGCRVDWTDNQPLCCPVRDRNLIEDRGYYLDVPELLGHADGEEGGPVMTWRDPFIYLDRGGQVHLFWAAKSNPTRGVIAHALVEQTPDGYEMQELLPPVDLPDGALFTQAELPKIYCDERNACYYLLVSTCNRFYEGQSDAEVDKTLRLYRSVSMDGPWEGATPAGSAISGLDGLFGMTVLRPEFENNRLLCISPTTDAVGPELSLTFSKPFYLDLNKARVSWP